MPTPPEPSERELRQIARIYRAGARDLAALLRSGTAFQRGQAARLLREVDDISARTAGASDAWVSGAVRRSYLRAARAADAAIAPAGIELPLGRAGAEWLRINEGAVRVFAGQIARDLAGANRDLADSARRAIRRTGQLLVAEPELERTVAKGLVSGGSLGRISRALRARLSEAGRELLDSGTLSPAELEEIADLEAGVVRAGKRRFDVGEYARLVASVQLREAATEAVVRRLERQGTALGDPLLFDLVAVTGPGVCCDVCNEYVDRVWSLSGRHPDHEWLDQRPPYHPNCTHNLAPWVEGISARDTGEAGGFAE